MYMKKRAFTLVELLIVIAIIGVLMGLLIPTISSAMNNAKAAKAKGFLSNMATAIEAHQKHYAVFPDFLRNSERVNLNDDDNAETLIKMLTGTAWGDEELSEADRKALNREKKNFMDFTNDSVVEVDGKFKIVDAFGNPNIYICVAKEGNKKFIKAGLPSEEDGFSEEDLKELKISPRTGLAAKVAVFTLKKDSEREDAEYEAENVFSW